VVGVQVESAPVGIGRVGGIQVGVNVGPPEPVDGLFRVADHRHVRCRPERFRVVEERPLEHLPLDSVGVLELVDVDHAESFSEAPGGRGADLRMVQGVVEDVDEVVKAQDSGAEAPVEDLPGHGSGQVSPVEGTIGQTVGGGPVRIGDHVGSAVLEDPLDHEPEPPLYLGGVELGLAVHLVRARVEGVRVVQELNEKRIADGLAANRR
jgi:hypothetical protein